MEKTFDAKAEEPRIYAAWEQAGAFRAGANAKPGKPAFTIMLPPPNVTGALHVGHAFNHTLMDILTRWHRMRGYDTLFQPGQDHAGIATQLQVEKKLKAEGNVRRTDMSREEFVGHVWDWKTQYGDTIINQMKRLGNSCDWDRNAFTMSGAPGAPEGNDGNFHDAVIRVFVEMYDKGLIYRGKRLVNWDPHFETAISDLEVENIETPGYMWHFKYPLAGGETYEYLEKDEDGNVVFREERDYISIATTRPETMLGDGAVAVHPSDERYAPIVGKLCEIPVGPKEHRRLIPIITDHYPDPTFGSGAVKITGAHDHNDYAVAQRGNIPMYRLMDTKGHMRDDGAPYAEAAARAQEMANGAEFTEAEVDTLNLVPDHLRGLDRFEARAKVVEEITAEGLAVMTVATDPRLGKPAKAPVSPEEGGEDRVEEENLVPLVEAKLIMQPFGDRSKVVIEPMLTDQWFVDAETVAKPALDSVREGRVKIVPESGEKVFYHWMENIEPWTISRQLWWGHQIPVWYGPPIASRPAWTDRQRELQEKHVRTGGPFNGKRAEFCGSSWDEVHAMAAEYYGDDRIIEVESLKELESFFETKGFADGTPLVRDPDVLDTWFSSGLWPFGTLGWPEQTEELSRYFPTDVLITGQDILFFWVARMMMMSEAIMGKEPFHTVYLHQLVRDEKGKKMSKTTGNVIDPLEIVDEFGADALRFTNASMAALGGVLKLSKDRIAGYRNFGTKIWNAARFAEMNEARPVPGFDPAEVTQTVNRWIVGEIARARLAHDEALEGYRFNDAANLLYAVTWGKVCDWYLEFAKPLLASDDDTVVAETRATLAWVIDQCLILLHPVMPFVTEALWGRIAKRDGMLVTTDWPDYGAELIDADADREMNWVIALIEEVRSVRAQMGVPAGAHVALVHTRLDPAAAAAWERNAAMIERLARIESLTGVSEMPKGAATLTVEGAAMALPLADLIDVGAEKARLEKAMSKLQKELGGLRGRLSNPKFAESAPEDVVEETRHNLSLREEEEAKIREALNRLAEIA
ncbi:valine--tRNA ligase [Rhodobacterales bacterium HKCCE3408]|nr:valine--tRNA ligase [Rhodobacterales bacterium HKCCE3408]